MKNPRQIVALVGVILLGLMYLAAIILALVDPTDGARYAIAALGATIIIPVVLWLFLRMAELSGKGKKQDESDTDKAEE